MAQLTLEIATEVLLCPDFACKLVYTRAFGVDGGFQLANLLQSPRPQMLLWLCHAEASLLLAVSMAAVEQEREGRRERKKAIFSNTKAFGAVEKIEAIYVTHVLGCGMLVCV